MTRRVTSGLEHYSSVSASRDGRRVVATVANPTTTLWRVPLLDRPAEDRDVQPYPLTERARVCAAFRRRSRCSICPHAAPATASGFEGRQDVRSLEGRGRLADRAAGRVARWQPRGRRRETRREAAAVDDGGRRHECTDPGADQSRSAASGGQGSARLVAGRHVDRRRGSRCDRGRAVQDPDGRQRTGSPRCPVTVDQSGLVAGWNADCVWRRGRRRPGSTARACRPDGTPVELPTVTGRASAAAIASCPNGTGLVYLPRGQSLDFWLLDLASEDRHGR